MSITGWNETTLRNEVELLYGKSLPESTRLDGSIPVYGSNGVVGFHNAAAVHGPGIIVGRKGSVGEVRFSSTPFWPIDTTYYVHNVAGHNWHFLYYLLSNMGLTHLNSHSAVPGLNRDTAYELTCHIPPTPEQEKIAAVLWKIQRAIEVEEKLTATSRELKQAAMRQLFTRGLLGEAQKETDIGPMPQSWEARPLEELRTFLQYGTSAKCDYSKDGNPVLRIPNIVDGGIDYRDLKWCRLTQREVDSLVLETGDVLFIRTNGVRERVGSCAVYHDQPERSLFASYLIRARLKTHELDPDYFQYFSNTPVGRAQLAGRATPASDGKFNVNTQHIDAILVPLPKTLNEQREIVGILQTIDRKISLHERKRAALQGLFQTLLHQLMTGEIRVADLDIDVSEVTA